MGMTREEAPKIRPDRFRMTRDERNAALAELSTLRPSRADNYGPARIPSLTFIKWVEANAPSFRK
jgi:hypothetical protein